MKRNISFSAYDNKNNPQTAENLLGIILLQVGAIFSLSLRFIVSYLLLWTWLHALTLTKERSSTHQLTVRRLQRHIQKAYHGEAKIF